MYGHRWAATYGETFGDSGPTGAMWQVALKGISNRQIAQGLHACITRDDGAWPPSLPEFRAMCIAGQASTLAAATVEAYVPQRADVAKFPSAERLQWHKDNIAWIEKGGELPRPGSVEPPAPEGCRSFWSIYKGQDLRTAAEKSQTYGALSEEWL